MTTAFTNYGSTFTFSGSSIGACLVVDHPEIKEGALKSTNHAGGGVREYLPDGLIGLGEFTLSIIVASGVLSTIKTAMAAKTIAACVITNPASETVTCSGFYTSIKEEAADAQSPDIIKATVTIQPTGAITFS